MKPGFVLCLLLLAAPALAQTADSVAVPKASAAVRALRAAPRGGDVQLDGRLDEAAWDSAAVASDFVQSYPDPGAEPTQRTEARVLYDDAALYVGVRMFDTAPDSIAAQLARRDATGIYSDWVHVNVDSYHDRRTAFRFSVNPRGIQKDVFHFDDTNEDVDWDAVWQVATQVDSLGWTAEYRIPLSQIRFSGAEADEGRVWGLQIQRDIARRDERDSWAPWTRQEPGYVSRFGDLTGLRGIRPVRRLELQPYASSRLTRAPGEAANPFYSETEAGASFGADVKVGITSGLTLTGTVNPDFGQVEVDPAVVNLSAFETFFPEKRPFFVEGADIFRFGDTGSNVNFNLEQFFYSRRVGRSPQRKLDGDEIEYVDAPDQSTILGAAKVSGKVGPWSIGVMDAVTGEEEARFLERYVAPAGDTLFRQRSTPVEPLTNYFVGRLRREIGGQTRVGGMLTATHRDMQDSIFSPLLRSRAWFGGVDGEHSWSDRTWTLAGYLAGSRVEGSTDVIAATQRGAARYYQRPDAGYLQLDSTRTSLDGHIGQLTLRRNGEIEATLDYTEVSPGFEINDLGFQARADYRSVSGFLGRFVNRSGRVFRNTRLYGFSLQAWNFGGDHIFSGIGANAGGTFSNFWEAGIGVDIRPGVTDDRLTRGGPLAHRPAEWTVSGGVESDDRKVVSYGAEGRYGRRSAGGNSAAIDVTLDYRPSSAVRLRLSPEVEWGHGTGQYVTSVEDPLVGPEFGGQRYVFADIDQTTVAMNTRLDWTFSPNLSLQLFAQPFVARGDYRNFKEFLRPEGYDFAVYGRERGTIAPTADCDEFGRSEPGYLIDPDGTGAANAFPVCERDFNLRSLRGNAVLRWEYRPGSALFFVWQQQREGTEAVGTFDFGRDVGDVFTAPATNVFLIKATYWIGR